MHRASFVIHDPIRTTSAAYLLAVGQAAIAEFAAKRGVDMATMQALHKEAVEAWAAQWGCDIDAVVTKAVEAAGHLKTFAQVTAPAPNTTPTAHQFHA